VAILKAIFQCQAINLVPKPFEDLIIGLANLNKSIQGSILHLRERDQASNFSKVPESSDETLAKLYYDH
jgi:hypothetical protein